MNHEPMYPRSVPVSVGARIHNYTAMMADLLIAQALGKEEFKRACTWHFMYPSHGEIQINKFSLRPKRFRVRIYIEIKRRAIYNALPPLQERFKGFNDYGRVFPKKAATA